MALTTIGLDGDDTLWHSENYFMLTTGRLVELLEPWARNVEPAADGEGSNRPPVEEKLLSIERDNLAYFGYGVKSFTLSMVQTAIEISDGLVAPEAIQTILDWGKDLIRHPVELIDGVEETLSTLAEDFRLILITKGDLIHQEAKIAMSGLEKSFSGLEIVSEKDLPTYSRVLDRYSVDAREFLMVGNSVRSDVLPVIELGGDAVHVPYEVTWALEVHEPTGEGSRPFHTLESIVQLPTLVDQLGR